MKVLPLYNVLVLPHSNIFFQKSLFRMLAGGNVYQGDQMIIMILKEQKARKDITEDSFYPLGVIAVVEEISEEGYVIIRTGNRVDIRQVAVNEEHEIFAEADPRPEIDDLDPHESRIQLQKIKEELKELSGRFRWGTIMNAYIDQYTCIEEAAAVLSPWLTISNEERYEVLKEDSAKARFEAIRKIIYEYIEVTKVTSDAQSAQQEDYQKAYKEQALKRQIEYLQK
jgi:ATP-dependent Lon protease